MPGTMPSRPNDGALTRQERRSLALHAAIAEKLGREPGRVIAKGHANLAKLRAVHTNRAPMLDQALDRWEEWLGLPPATLAKKITAKGEGAAYMRHVSVFAGTLTPEERNRIIRGMNPPQKGGNGDRR